MTAEPASAASLAGVRELVRRGTIEADERVVCVLTGHLLKDPELVRAYHADELAGVVADGANPPLVIDPEPDALRRVLDGGAGSL